jgi:hypothetical protein
MPLSYALATHNIIVPSNFHLNHTHRRTDIAILVHPHYPNVAGIPGSNETVDDT